MKLAHKIGNQRRSFVKPIVLGHVSIDTTSIYAEADLKMKLDALRRVKKTIPVFASKKWNASEDILSFLENK